MTPGRRFSAVVLLLSRATSSGMSQDAGAGVWVPPSLASKSRRHQCAVHHCSHCSDLIGQNKSLRERRGNSHLKSPVWKAAAPVAEYREASLSSAHSRMGAFGQGQRKEVQGCPKPVRTGWALCFVVTPGPGFKWISAAPSLPQAPLAPQPRACPEPCQQHQLPAHTAHTEGMLGVPCAPKEVVPGRVTCSLTHLPRAEAAATCSALLWLL